MGVRLSGRRRIRSAGTSWPARRSHKMPGPRPQRWRLKSARTGTSLRNHSAFRPALSLVAGDAEPAQRRRQIEGGKMVGRKRRDHRQRGQHRFERRHCRDALRPAKLGARPILEAVGSAWHNQKPSETDFVRAPRVCGVSARRWQAGCARIIARSVPYARPISCSSSEFDVPLPKLDRLRIEPSTRMPRPILCGISKG